MQRPARIVAVVMASGFALVSVGVPGAASSATPPKTPIVPDRARQGQPGTPTSTAPVRGVRTAYQFPGMGPCEAGFCWTPGEPVVAVGTADVLETVNTAVTVYAKASGAKLAEFDFGTFWGSGVTSCVDPRALYLASVGRFAFSCTDNSNGGNGPLRFAISQTSDPTGAWFRYAVSNASFLDQDKIEATSDKFVIAGNTSTTEEIYVYNLSDVVAGAASPTVVHKSATKSNLYQAAIEQTAVSNAYFVSSYPGNSLYLATVTGTPAGGNVAVTEKLIKSTDFPAPHEPSVPGGNIGGGALDGRIYAAIYEVETTGHKPVIQYSSARQCGSRTCVTSARIDLSGTKPVLASNALVGEPGFDYTYGAVGMDAAGNVFEVYSRSSPSSTPSSAVVGPGFDVTLQVSVPGTTSCAGTACDERWGDYLGTASDPSDPTSVWVAGLYQNTNGGFGWGTVISKVSLATFSLPTVSTGAASSIGSTGATVDGTVNPNGVATAYHFDYGVTKGYDSATSTTSAGSGTSPVPVSANLTGLQPNTLYHYRLVATTSVGSAVGLDRTFKTSAPKVTSVTFVGLAGKPTVTVTGSDFGTKPPADPSTPLTCVAGDTSFDYGPSGLWFQDQTRGWTAGQGPGDCIGLVVSSYSDTKIVFKFGADYPNVPKVTRGDRFTMTIWAKSFTGTVA